MREITYAEAIREALRQEMRRDERVFILGEDVGVYGGAFGAQTFLEFTYPVFKDIFFFSIRAGYVFCTIPQPFTLLDSEKGVSYSLPDIDLSGLLATVGFTAEF